MGPVALVKYIQVFFIKFKTLNFVFKYKPYCFFKFSFLKLHEPITCQIEDFEKKHTHEVNHQLTTLQEIKSFSSAETLNLCCVKKKKKIQLSPNLKSIFPVICFREITDKFFNVHCGFLFVFNSQNRKTI